MNPLVEFHRLGDVPVDERESPDLPLRMFLTDARAVFHRADDVSFGH